MPRFQFACGYCGRETGVREGYQTEAGTNAPYPLIYICGGCNRPTYFERGGQTPAPLLGKSVEGVPSQVLTMYEEARRCTGVEAYTACVLTCRSLLMHLAEEKGAEKQSNFVKTIEYLDEKHYIPPDGKEWVDRIRLQGNKATHEPMIMGKQDAFELLLFAEMLLRFIYEFPARVKATQTAQGEAKHNP
jgi:hypothetical protein